MSQCKVGLSLTVHAATSRRFVKAQAWSIKPATHFSVSLSVTKLLNGPYPRSCEPITCAYLFLWYFSKSNYTYMCYTTIRWTMCTNKCYLFSLLCLLYPQKCQTLLIRLLTLNTTFLSLHDGNLWISSSTSTVRLCKFLIILPKCIATKTGRCCFANRCTLFYDNHYTHAYSLLASTHLIGVYEATLRGQWA